MAQQKHVSHSENEDSPLHASSHTDQKASAPSRSTRSVSTASAAYDTKPQEEDQEISESSIGIKPNKRKRTRDGDDTAVPQESTSSQTRRFVKKPDMRNAQRQHEQASEDEEHDELADDDDEFRVKAQTKRTILKALGCGTVSSADAMDKCIGDIHELGRCCHSKRGPKSVPQSQCITPANTTGTAYIAKSRRPPSSLSSRRTSKRMRVSSSANTPPAASSSTNTQALTSTSANVSAPSNSDALPTYQHVVKMGTSATPQLSLRSVSRSSAQHETPLHTALHLIDEEHLMPKIGDTNQQDRIYGDLTYCLSKDNASLARSFLLLHNSGQRGGFIMRILRDEGISRDLYNLSILHLQNVCLQFSTCNLRMLADMSNTRTRSSRLTACAAPSIATRTVISTHSVRATFNRDAHSHLHSQRARPPSIATRTVISAHSVRGHLQSRRARSSPLTARMATFNRDAHGHLHSQRARPPSIATRTVISTHSVRSHLQSRRARSSPLTACAATFNRDAHGHLHSQRARPPSIATRTVISTHSVRGHP
ncbi:hypothetical protein BDZ89DRAFT_1043655 [Hymenopellis radicata]|nr:hypothetical protein BDZ89DRAFT_1043655 [Hymenopellis radicata]